MQDAIAATGGTPAPSVCKLLASFDDCGIGDTVDIYVLRNRGLVSAAVDPGSGKRQGQVRTVCRGAPSKPPARAEHAGSRQKLSVRRLHIGI
ncbi:MAG: hypothetical protein AMJ66_05505 [Betaproteobacteria bacterium SG8_40]|nr:MAG: hypothetical protein AMJ66_05505 [Betaproteobacteria bacterium SG8_40]